LGLVHGSFDNCFEASELCLLNHKQYLIMNKVYVTITHTCG